MKIPYHLLKIFRAGSSYGLIIIVLTILTQTGCKKLIDVPAPETSITNQNVYSTDASAIAVMTGVYINMGYNYSIQNSPLLSLSLYPALSADELSQYGNSNRSFNFYYTNNLTSSNTSPDYWEGIYPVLYTVNSVLEGVGASNTLTPAVKQQLLGEAQFMRAFCYFYLVNLYGDVPLVTTTDYKINTAIARSPKAQVWAQIIADLTASQANLSKNYVDASLRNVTTQRLRPTYWAATALLARVYLYNKQWQDALSQATAVINNNSTFSLDTLNGVFLANSTEAIWQLQPVQAGNNTAAAQLFVLPSSGPSDSFQVYLNPALVGAFEPGDQRKTKWTGSVSANNTTYYYAYKYKVNTAPAPVTEYEMVMRLAELYLIRAEAEANSTGTAAAVNDINVIRNRAGLPNYAGAADRPGLTAAILHERQVELFTEWGHRWLDLKRSNMVDVVMSNVTPLKGGTWSTNKQLYPIPLLELRNDYLLKQNPGY